MKTGLHQLLSRPSEMTVCEVIRWWEIRRLAFNILVGAAGVCAIAIMFTIGALMERHGYDAVGIPDPPIVAVFGMILYAILANLSYTAGWIAELIARHFWPAQAASFGKVSFALGLFGSIGLTLVPALLTVMVAFGELIAKTPRSP